MLFVLLDTIRLWPKLFSLKLPNSQFYYVQLWWELSYKHTLRLRHYLGEFGWGSGAYGISCRARKDLASVSSTQDRHSCLSRQRPGLFEDVWSLQHGFVPACKLQQCKSTKSAYVGLWISDPANGANEHEDRPRMDARATRLLELQQARNYVWGDVPLCRS